MMTEILNTWPRCKCPKSPICRRSCSNGASARPIPPSGTNGFRQMAAVPPTAQQSSATLKHLIPAPVLAALRSGSRWKTPARDFPVWSDGANSGRFFQMAGLVDPADVSLAVLDIDLVEAARALFEPPVGRQRQIEKLQKERAVHAVVADNHDRTARVAGQHEAQGVGHARSEILQRLAAGETHQLRRFEPGGEEGGIVGLRILEGLELPAAVVDVIEVIARLAGRKSAGARDGRAGLHAAFHRARVDALGLP